MSHGQKITKIFFSYSLWRRRSDFLESSGFIGIFRSCRWVSWCLNHPNMFPFLHSGSTCFQPSNMFDLSTDLCPADTLNTSSSVVGAL
ncbi:hypothetical protein K438DRAFT_1871350 [Mycena galopus ATCC 62051]|nr:hypothetical protein K438DRAFT_1871350 [Mycena galopus ATCC 62051]